VFSVYPDEHAHFIFIPSVVFVVVLLPFVPEKKKKKNCCESRKIEVKFRNILLSVYGSEAITYLSALL
jgi:hypothetical protein